MSQLIVADIGGTHARFGVASFAADGGFVITHQRAFNCAEFAGFLDCVQSYMGMLPAVEINSACFAFAGPVPVAGAADDEIVMTNIHWRISISAAKRDLGLENLEAINDFAAQACAIPYLEPSQLSVIKPGISVPNANKSLIGPGTGLGIASLIYSDGGWHPVPGEGGHVAFSYPTVLSRDIIDVLNKKFDSVSLETLLSGGGLINIYQALAAVSNVAAQDYSSGDITRFGVNQSDPVCTQTLNLFCELLGAAAGDLALINGSKGGIYLAGGILPRIEPFLKSSNFVRLFNSKGKMSKYLDDIPVFLVNQNNSALFGAAAWFVMHAKKRV